jgi:predicted short-subunit dehydrogenase-like oxidoreductase (DUF2520 family)
MKTKTTIAIIGAGKIAFSLTSALLKAGYTINTVISKNINSAKTLAEKFGIKKYSDDISLIPKLTNVFFLTVPDGQIKKAAQRLSMQNLNLKKSFFIHFSGAEDISVLKSLKEKGGNTASIHLMQTFPSKKIVELKGVHAAIETNDESAYKFLLKLSNDLQLVPFRIESRNKTYYHLAGVFASNFLAGNLFNAEELLLLNNIDDQKHFDILSSTIQATLRNIKKVGASRALSGPVERGDIKTIRKHISSLKKMSKQTNGNKFSTLLKNYIVQSLNLIKLVEEKHGELKKSHYDIRELLVRELRNIEKSI